MKSLKLKVGQNSLWKFKRLKQILYAYCNHCIWCQKDFKKLFRHNIFTIFNWISMQVLFTLELVSCMTLCSYATVRMNERNAILSTQSLRQLCSICKCATAEHRPRPVARVSDILFQVHKACETSNFFERILSWISDFKPDHAPVFMIDLKWT